MSLVVAAAFPIGALSSAFVKFPTRVKADIASFSAGIFLAAVTFSIIEEAVKLGNVPTTALGFAIGAFTFSLVRYFIQKKQQQEHNQNHDPPSQSEGQQQNQDQEKKQIANNAMDNGSSTRMSANGGAGGSSGSCSNKGNGSNSTSESVKDNSSSGSSSGGSGGGGKMVIVGTLADSHPETIIIGIILGLGIPGLIPTVLTLFIGNFTATVEGTGRMINSGLSAREVFKRWMYVFAAVAIGGPIGYFIARPVNPDLLSIVVAFAAGALISFVTEELIPEAYKRVEWHIGLSAAAGLFVGFSIFHFL
jgi:zinc transporter ZupT